MEEILKDPFNQLPQGGVVYTLWEQCYSPQRIYESNQILKLQLLRRFKKRSSLHDRALLYLKLSTITRVLHGKNACLEQEFE